MDRIDVDTDRLRTSVWRSGTENGVPLLLIHGNLVSGRFWRDVAAKLPDRFSIAAPDLRGFGRTEAKPIDATRGLADWTDDVEALVKALGWRGRQLHIAGWSMGGGIAMDYATRHQDEVASLTLVAPMSPFGFGATRDAKGTLATADAAGCGGGAVNPEFLRRFAAGDTSSDEPTSSPRVTMSSFFWSPKYKAPDEDELLAEVLLTKVGDDFYPGDSKASTNWPGMAPGVRGVNNAFSPLYCDTSAFGDIRKQFPIVWVRGDEDQVISDTSFFDLAYLGKLGAVPGWPGDDVCPPQPMLQQIRAVLDRYRKTSGAEIREVVLEGVGHGPLIERSDRVADLIKEVALLKA
ncbi:MAG: alpha/beta hydrolase [Chloroflexi bacterium]|nr:MAG: alpha/beta hydrolase [Chloroflexota bacterium]